MSDLTDYMNDHLGGSMTGVQLVGTIRGSFDGTELGTLAAKLTEEIEEDRDALKEMIEALGDSPSNLKQAGGWLGEKGTALLKARGDDAISRLTLVEALSLGVEGKASLWRALLEVDAPELDAARLTALLKRAERQRADLEPHRLAAARELATG
jgi:hypothetical protein